MSDTTTFLLQNGKYITLEPQDMWKIFEYVQHDGDVQDIVNGLENISDEQHDIDDSNVTYYSIYEKEYHISDMDINCMAYDMRRLLDRGECSFETARNSTIEKFLIECDEELDKESEEC